MTKKELIKGLSELLDFTQIEAGEIVNTVFGMIEDALIEGEEVSISNFGKFIPVKVEEREARNPKTGEIVTVAEHSKPKFKASSVLKNKMK